MQLSLVRIRFILRRSAGTCLFDQIARGNEQPPRDSFFVNVSASGRTSDYASPSVHKEVARKRIAVDRTDIRSQICVSQGWLRSAPRASSSCRTVVLKIAADRNFMAWSGNVRRLAPHTGDDPTIIFWHCSRLDVKETPPELDRSWWRNPIVEQPHVDSTGESNPHLPFQGKGNEGTGGLPSPGKPRPRPVPATASLWREPQSSIPRTLLMAGQEMESSQTATRRGSIAARYSTRFFPSLKPREIPSKHHSFSLMEQVSHAMDITVPSRSSGAPHCDSSPRVRSDQHGSESTRGFLSRAQQSGHR